MHDLAISRNEDDLKVFKMYYSSENMHCFLNNPVSHGRNLLYKTHVHNVYNRVLRVAIVKADLNVIDKILAHVLNHREINVFNLDYSNVVNEINHVYTNSYLFF